MTEQMRDIIKFKRERDAALLTGDIYEVRRFAQKYFKHLPPVKSLRSEIAAMHKAIVDADSLPREYRLKSRAWLIAEGFELPSKREAELTQSIIREHKQ